MSELILRVHTSHGVELGYFADPKVELITNDHYEIEGTFLEPGGQPALRVEFNPQVLPYVITVAKPGSLKHNSIKQVYVQRGRQPVVMTGVGVSP